MNDETDYSKPVAYDQQGRPLYARPPAGTDSAAANPTEPAPAEAPGAGIREPAQAVHQYVHLSRPMDPAHPDIPPEIVQRHAESSKQYPRLNLSNGEYVISAVKRHPIGIVQIWAIALVLIGALAALMASFLADNGSNNDTVLLSAAGLGLVSFLIFGGALVATYVYNNNRFFLTNESVIQEIQNTLFSNHEQTVSLANIEDASFKQNGVLPHLFNYGLIRLSTEGDETTYRFNYVSDPKRQIAILNNAVEAFKNGRPIE